MDLPDWVARRSLALRQPGRRPPLEVPGRPRAAAGLAWLHCEGDHRLERHQSLHANGKRQRVGG